MKKYLKRSKKAKAPSMGSDVVMLQTERDFQAALLMVSVVANLFVLCLWVALQVTNRYDTALSLFFFDR